MGKSRRPPLEAGGRARTTGPHVVLRDAGGAGAQRVPELPEAPRLPHARHRQLPGLQRGAGTCPPPTLGSCPATPTALPSATDSCNSHLHLRCTTSKLLILSHSIKNRHLCVRSLAAALLTSPRTPSVAATRQLQGGLPQEPLRRQSALPGHQRKVQVAGAEAEGGGGLPAALRASRPLWPPFPQRSGEHLPDAS